MAVRPYERLFSMLCQQCIIPRNQVEYTRIIQSIQVVALLRPPSQRAAGIKISGKTMEATST
jgi:hypothetical protein